MMPQGPQLQQRQQAAPMPPQQGQTMGADPEKLKLEIRTKIQELQSLIQRAQEMGMDMQDVVGPGPEAGM